MTKLSAIEKFAVPVTIATPQKTEQKRAKLSMTWRLDPTTGKPVACWVADGTDTVRNFELESAA